MKILGLALRKPHFSEMTAAAVMGTGLWLAALGLARSLQLPLERFDAGALLVVVLWGCFSARLGIHIGQGQRHLLANLLVGAALLLVYQAAWWAVAP